MKKSTFISTLLACSTAFGGVYVVKSGDTLSNILFKNVPGRIYGKTGSLSKLLVQNPQIKNPNIIKTGDKINLLNEFTVRPRETAQAESPVLDLEKVVKKKTQRNYNQAISFSLNLNSESINAIETSTSSNEIATSDLAYGLSMRWSHKWSSNLNFLFDASFSKYEFNVAADKSLAEKSLTKMYAGIGLKYIPNKNHSYILGAGLGESFILMSKNLSTLEIKKAVIPNLSVSGNHILKTFKTGFSVNSFWRAGTLLPSSQAGYNTKLGTYWSIGAGSFYNQDGKTYNISLSYGQRALETGDIKQTNKNIGVSAGVGFDF